MITRRTPVTDSCGKIRFATRKAAETAKAIYEKRYDRKYRVYSHPRCSGFHLTKDE